MGRHVFLTGASGLLGGATLQRLLSADTDLTATVLVRDLERWNAGRTRWVADHRVSAVLGDVVEPGLGLSASAARRIRERTTHVMHAAANTRFSQTLPQGRRINTTGTAHVLDMFAGAELDRFLFVSTAFVAGASTGPIPEAELTDVPHWVNAYERSKHEAEAVVRSSGVPFVIARSSTVACDDRSGFVTQVGALHQALHLFHSGLAAMLPGSETTTVDLVTTDYVAKALAHLLTDDGAAGTYHLCAGDGALPLGELLDRSRTVWLESQRWRGRGIERPVVTSLETYRLFERSIAETGDARIRAITRGLATFVPQLAFPKRFETARASIQLGFDAFPVESYWEALCRHLRSARWDSDARRVG